MSTNLTTQSDAEIQPDPEIAGRPVRWHRVALLAVGVAAVVASAGGIAVARGGDADPASVTPSARSVPELSCVQLAQMGPGSNGTLSDAALVTWRQMWTDARC